MNRMQRRAEVLPEYPLNLTITFVCQKLHEAMTGAWESVPPLLLSEYVRFLRVCLETWEPHGHPTLAKYDAAMKQLIEAVLTEADCAGFTDHQKLPEAPPAGG